MFNKQLRFSIFTLLLILIANNCYSSFAQVINGTNTEGWTLHNSTTYPPKVNGERYLYFTGNTSDLRGLKIEVRSIPTNGSKLPTSASVSFEYWGYGGEVNTIDTDGYSATTLFSLGVSFQSEARPKTVWATFNDSNLGNMVGDVWGKFETVSVDPIYPARIMITPVLTVTPQTYYVALKSIQVNYYFEDSIIVTLNDTDADGNVTLREETQTTNSAISLTCTSESCSDFVLTNGVTHHWSDLHFPTNPSSFSKFYTPNTVSPYSVTVTKEDATDTCVSVNYWLTAGAHLTVSMASSTATIVLSPTYLLTPSTDNSMYGWYTTEFCLSNYFFNLPAGNYQLSLTPSPIMAPNYIAIGEITETSITTPTLANPTAEIILQSWSKSSVSPTNDWLYLPNVATVSTDSLTFQTIAPGNGMIYVVSTWFNMSSGLELRQQMNITSCASSVNVTLQLIDSNNNLIETQNSDLCSTSTLSQKIYSITQGAIGEAHRLQFVIDYNQTSSTPATLELSAVDLSDACRLDRAECFFHGNCIVNSPNIATCQCDSGYMREKCSKPDYCVLTFSITGTTDMTSGENYCTNRNGTCNSETFDPETRPICDCESATYWKVDETSDLGHSCAAFDPCTGINAFCPTGTACDSTTSSCTACDTTNGYVKNSAAQCVKSNACDASPCLAGAECKTDPNGVAVCYCNNGTVYDTTMGCDVDSCSWDTRKSLGCEHTCKVELGEAGCDCFSGWNITLGSTTECTQLADFNCTTSCTSITGSICIEDVNGASVCSCLPGYVQVGSECVNICQGAAANNTDAINQVILICGTSTCTFDSTDKLTCECGKPYVLGADGRCKIDTPCLSGGQGHSECSARGAICQPRLQIAQVANPWQCVCPTGTYQAANGTCVDQCSMGEKTCLFDNAVCQRSTVLGASSHECVCQPGLKKNANDNKCYLIEHSLRVEMVVRLEEKQVTTADTELQKKITSYYMAPAVTDTCSQYSSLDISGCVDYLTQAAQEKAEMLKPAAMEAAIRDMLKTTLKSDLTNVYGSTFGDINIITYSKSDPTSFGGDYKSIVSIELTDPTVDTTSHLTALNDAAVCHTFPTTIPEASSYCFIPTNSVIQRNSIIQTDLSPCNETYINYCPANTQCKPLDYSRFACDCNPGFKAETVIQMDSTSRTDYYKEYCEDIDECSATTSPCREHSTCINTNGGYQCPCNHEYIEDISTGTCVGVCSTVNCVYGDCYVVANNTGACRCHEGYRGETCSEQDPLVTTFRTALITVAVVLGLLLIGVVLVAIILIKKTKRSAMQKNAERPMAEYGRPQVPKRYQDNSGFTND